MKKLFICRYLFVIDNHGVCISFVHGIQNKLPLSHSLKNTKAWFPKGIVAIVAQMSSYSGWARRKLSALLKCQDDFTGLTLSPKEKKN